MAEDHIERSYYIQSGEFLNLKGPCLCFYRDPIFGLFMREFDPVSECCNSLEIPERTQWTLE